MFQFSGLTSDIIGYLIAKVGCPIRIFTDQRLFAPPRNFSQLITSFVVSESQGIHRTPLLTFFYLLYLQVYYNFYLFFPNMSKNFITPPPLPGSRTGYPFASDRELNVDINGVEPSHLYAPPHILVIPVFLELFMLLFFLFSSFRLKTSSWWRIRESNP